VSSERRGGWNGLAPLRQADAGDSGLPVGNRRSAGSHASVLRNQSLMRGHLPLPSATVA
jgi:hypothetical protein